MDLSHAFAVLGLPPAATPDEVRERYRLLVRRWHPDRFAADPPGAAEATEKMRVLNEAVAVIQANLAESIGIDQPTPGRFDDTPQFGRRLTRQEIDKISIAVGTESWAGFMGRVVVVLVPFFGGAELLSKTGPLKPWREVSGYDQLLGYLLVVTGILLGIRLFGTRREGDAG